MSRQIEQSENVLEHFALIYIDHEGNLRHQVSASIFDSVQSILSPQVTRAFLKAVAESRISSFPEPPDSKPVPSTAPSNVTRTAEQRATQRQKRRARIQKQDSHSRAAISSTAAQLHATIRLPLNQQDLLRQYYEKVFQNLQQVNCRVIAKTYVRLVEPRKQVHHPYNGRKLVDGKTLQFNPEETKPPWWPLGVTHREPDHLPKSERIALLIHILCELRTSHGITARKLKSAGQPVQHQIAPIERLQLLDELYRVREAEETFLDAMIDRDASVSISNANLPQNFAETVPENLSENLFVDLERACRQSEYSNEESCGTPKENTIMTMQTVGFDTPECPYHIMNEPIQEPLLPDLPFLSSQDLERKYSCGEDDLSTFSPVGSSSFPFHLSILENLMNVPQ